MMVKLANGTAFLNDALPWALGDKMAPAGRLESFLSDQLSDQLGGISQWITSAVPAA